MHNNCIVSLREALKQAGLDDQPNHVPPRIMAERLRPPSRSRPSSVTSHLGEPARSRGERPLPARRTRSMRANILLLAFVVGLIPAVSIGALIWVLTWRGLSASSCQL